MDRPLGTPVWATAMSAESRDSREDMVMVGRRCASGMATSNWHAAQAARSLTALAAAALLAGCSQGVTASSHQTTVGPTAPPPAAASTTSPTALSSSTPTGAARVLVAGTGTCMLDDMVESTEGQVRTTTATLRCANVMSDTRAGGELEGPITLAMVSVAGLELNHWSAEVTLGNAGGVWEGTVWGSDYWDPDGQLHNTGTGLLVGGRGYEGLVYRLLSAQVPGAEEVLFSGWIEEAP